MGIRFRSGLEVLWESCFNPGLTTGSVELDSLIGGVEKGLFHLFYGDQESGVDHLIHRILVNSTLPPEKGGWGCKAVYLNCGNYKYERTILDINLLTWTLRLNRLDVSEALNRIYAIPAYSEEQEEDSAAKILGLLEQDEEVKLVVAHNIAKLFTATTRPHEKDAKARITRLQGIVGGIKQACRDNEASLVASCRPLEASRSRLPPPEGGKYLRHLANIIVYLRKVGRGKPYVAAFLVKHPNRPPKRTDLTSLTEVGDVGRITIPFRTRLREELNNLKRTFQEALMDPGRREAFDELSKAWTAEQGAMSYCKVPTVLDALFLTSTVDNRKTVDELISQLDALRSEIQELKQSGCKAKGESEAHP